MNDSWPEIIRDGKSRNKSRSSTDSSLNSIVIRFEDLDIVSRPVLSRFPLFFVSPTGNRGENGFLKNFFPTARLSVDYSQSLKIADSPAVNRKDSGKKKLENRDRFLYKYIQQVSIETIARSLVCFQFEILRALSDP